MYGSMLEVASSRTSSLGFVNKVLAKLINCLCPIEMFDDPSYDEARRDANRVADVLRQHGPFEPHRKPLAEMEYTTMPEVMAKIKDRFTKLE